MRGKIIFFLFILLFFYGISSCKKDQADSPIVLNETPYNPISYSLIIPKFFPTEIYIPADNPFTKEGIELGRYLFYDGRLGGRSHPDSLMSCFTCHKQENSFENGAGYAYGVTGIKTPHSQLPLINIAWNPNILLWNGKVSRLEDLVWMGITAPHEMNSDTNRSKAMIQSVTMYPPLFKKAFGSETVTLKNMSRAIAQFIRTLVSSNSKFDRYIRGEENLTPEEMNGYVIFNTEKGDCFHCHGGILFTTNGFYNNAKDTVFTDTRDRYALTLNAFDKGAYRAPTLRNIELTAPYMHDARFTTLDQVIDFYSEGLKYTPYVHPLMKFVNDGGVHLTPQEKLDLKAFLKTLTDQSFITNKDYSNPFQ